MRQGKFAHIDGMTKERRPGTLQVQRFYTRRWLVAVAKELGVTPDFSEIDRASDA